MYNSVKSGGINITKVNLDADINKKFGFYLYNHSMEDYRPNHGLFQVKQIRISNPYPHHKHQGLSEQSCSWVSTPP